MAAQFLKPSETLSDFSPIHIGVALNPVPKPSSKLPWWAMSEPGECGEIGSSLLPLLFRLNDRRLWRLALQPFGKVLVPDRNRVKLGVRRFRDTGEQVHLDWVAVSRWSGYDRIRIPARGRESGKPNLPCQNGCCEIASQSINP